MLWIYFFSCFIFLGYINGFPTFQALIPNGNKVKHPCGNGIWNAVGHMTPEHTPQKNSFGILWRSSERKWNRAICEADSDGDGLTNGEELGDANCDWKRRGDHVDPVLGHPGICDEGRQKCDGNSTSLFSGCRYPLHWSENIQVPDHPHPPPGANDHPQNSKRKALNRARAMNNAMQNSRIDPSGFRGRVDTSRSGSNTDTSDMGWGMNRDIGRNIDRSMRPDQGIDGNIDRGFSGVVDRGTGSNTERGFNGGVERAIGGNTDGGFSGRVDRGMRRDVNNEGVDRNAMRRTMIGKNVFGGTRPIRGDTAYPPIGSIIPDSPGPIDTSGPMSTGEHVPIDTMVRDHRDHDRGSRGNDRGNEPNLNEMHRFIDMPAMSGSSGRRTDLGSTGIHVPTRMSGSDHGRMSRQEDTGTILSSSRVPSMSTGFDTSRVHPNPQYRGRMPASVSTFTGRTHGGSPGDSRSFTTGSLDSSVIRNSVMGRIARMRNGGGRIQSGPIPGGSTSAYTRPIQSHRRSSRRHQYPAHWRTHSSSRSSTSSTGGYPPRRFRHGHAYPPGYP